MFVRKDGELGIPEEFILEVNENNSGVLAYRSKKHGVVLVASGIEKITEEKAKSLIKEIKS